MANNTITDILESHDHWWQDCPCYRKFATSCDECLWHFLRDFNRDIKLMLGRRPRWTEIANHVAMMGVGDDMPAFYNDGLRTLLDHYGAVPALRRIFREDLRKILAGKEERICTREEFCRWILQWLK